MFVEKKKVSNVKHTRIDQDIHTISLKQNIPFYSGKLEKWNNARIIHYRTDVLLQSFSLLCSATYLENKGSILSYV